MKRDRRLFLNTATPLLLEIVTVVSWLILPRLIITHYGSEVNGLVQSITQFLGLIAFLDMGVGSVIRFNLYKPLAYRDEDQISRIVAAAKRFFRILALILLGYTLVLMLVYPRFGKQEFESGYTALLIAAMSLSSFAQYYFGEVNQLLLTADQRAYVPYAAQILTVILNTVCSVLLIECGADIRTVKLGTSLIFLLRPIFLQWYVRKHYRINKKITWEEEPIQQKWNGVAQHLSTVVMDHADVIVLTVLSTLAKVSVYTVYHMVVTGVRVLITTATSGIQAKLGNILAREDDGELQTVFSATEWILHTAAVFLFGCTLVLIVPFVAVYTRGVTDAEYHVPVFAALITLAYASHSLRLPYSMLILAAGHYRQTQHCHFLAAGMNIVLSVVLVQRYGLVGVAVGTLAAMAYQTVWMAWYSYRHILKRSPGRFWKQLFTDFVELVLIFAVTSRIHMEVSTYLRWIVLAAADAAVSGGLILAVNTVVYRHQLSGAWQRLRNARHGDHVDSEKQ